jgi:hypothetical protein
VRVELHELLKHTPDVDLTVYEVKLGDREKQASITVADWKEALLATNVLSRRVHGLLAEIERAEKRIDSVERGVQAIAAYHE